MIEIKNVKDLEELKIKPCKWYNASSKGYSCRFRVIHDDTLPDKIKDEIKYRLALNEVVKLKLED